MRVYLSSPIENTELQDVHEWRDYCKKTLWADCIDPTEFKPASYDRLALMDLVIKEKEAIDSCDFLFLFFWKHSAGTPMEQLYAFERGKQVWLIRGGKLAPSIWTVCHATREFTSLPEAVRAFNVEYGVDYVA